MTRTTTAVGLRRVSSHVTVFGEGRLRFYDTRSWFARAARASRFKTRHFVAREHAAVYSSYDCHNDILVALNEIRSLLCPNTPFQEQDHMPRELFPYGFPLFLEKKAGEVDSPALVP